MKQLTEQNQAGGDDACPVIGLRRPTAAWQRMGNSLICHRLLL